MAFPTFSLADAERFVREKEALGQYYGIMNKAREIMRQAYYETPEGKAEARLVQELAALRRKERAEAEARREAEDAEMQRRYEERSLKLAAAKAAREARTERDRKRERRSRIKWSEIIDDEYTVKMQIAWERRWTALAMSDAGLSSKVIGERLGVSRGRANQLVHQARQERILHIRSPAEKWMDAPAVVADYCDFTMRQTVAAIVPRDDGDDADLIWMGLAA